MFEGWTTAGRPCNLCGPSGTSVPAIYADRRGRRSLQFIRDSEGVVPYIFHWDLLILTYNNFAFRVFYIGFLFAADNDGKAESYYSHSSHIHQRYNDKAGKN